MTTLKAPELLLPAGSLDKMRAAYDFGADAVYAGQPRYSLRARNNEFRLEQIGIGIAEAHARGKKFFLTSNLLPHNDKVRTYIRDIEPIIAMKPDALIMADPGLIMMVREKWPEVPVHLSVQANTVGQLIASAKSQPGKYSMGHGGNGTAMHLSTALFSQMADIKLTEVPYRGSGPAAMDALSGQIPLALTDLPAALQHIKAGKLKAFAVTSPHRLASLPDVPTLAESGLSGYDSTGWFGLVAPAGTPAPILNRLHAEFTAALNDEGIRAQMRNIGMEPVPSSIDAFDAYLKSETRKWGEVIRKANIKLQ